MRILKFIWWLIKVSIVLAVIALSSFMIATWYFDGVQDELIYEQKSNVELFEENFSNNVLLAHGEEVKVLNDIFDQTYQSNEFNQVLLQEIEHSNILSAVFIDSDGVFRGITFDGSTYVDVLDQNLELDLKAYKSFKEEKYYLTPIRNYTYNEQQIVFANNNELVVDYVSPKFTDGQLSGYFVVSVSVTEALNDLSLLTSDYESIYLLNQDAVIINLFGNETVLETNPTFYDQYKNYSRGYLNSYIPIFSSETMIVSKSLELSNGESMFVLDAFANCSVASVFDENHPKSPYFVIDYQTTLLDSINYQGIIGVFITLFLLDKMYRFVSEKSQFSRLKRRSERDSLTGLFNRSYTIAAIKRLVPSNGNVSQFTVAFIDVNGLKEINDNTGHQAGDILLKKVAFVLRSENRSNHILARLGGDEFLVVAKNTSIVNLKKYFSRVMVAFQEINASAKYDFNFSLSYGIKDSIEYLEEIGGPSSFDRNAFVEGLVQAADDLMYENKKHVKAISPSVIKSSVYVKKYEELLSRYDRFANFEALMVEINANFNQKTTKFYISNAEGKVVYPRDLDEFGVPYDVLVHTDTMSEVSIEDRFSHKFKKEYCVIDKRVMFDTNNYAYVTVVLEKSFASNVDIILSKIGDDSLFEAMYHVSDIESFNDATTTSLATMANTMGCKKVFTYLYDDSGEHAHLVAKYDPNNIFKEQEIIKTSTLSTTIARLSGHEVVNYEGTAQLDQDDHYLVEKFKKHKFKRVLLFPLMKNESVYGFISMYDANHDKSSVRQEVLRFSKLVDVFSRTFDYALRVFNSNFSKRVYKKAVSKASEGVMILTNDKVDFITVDFESLFKIDSNDLSEICSKIDKVTKSDLFTKQYQNIAKSKQTSYTFKKSKLASRKNKYELSLELIESGLSINHSVLVTVSKR